MNQLHECKDTSTLLWIGGILGTLVFVYYGYKLIVDPGFLESVRKSTPPTSPGNGPDINLNDTIINSDPNSGIINSMLSITNKLNPLNWFTSASEMNKSAENFLERQNSIHTNDLRYYPFTDNNPYDSYLKQLRISWLGETTYELSNRLRDKALAYRELDILGVKSPATTLGHLTPLSGFGTPRIGTVGLGNRWVSNTGLFDSSIASTSYNTVLEKTNSIPNTPTTIPTFFLKKI